MYVFDGGVWPNAYSDGSEVSGDLAAAGSCWQLLAGTGPRPRVHPLPAARPQLPLRGSWGQAAGELRPTAASWFMARHHRRPSRSYIAVTPRPPHTLLGPYIRWSGGDQQHVCAFKTMPLSPRGGLGARLGAAVGRVGRAGAQAAGTSWIPVAMHMPASSCQLPRWFCVGEAPCDLGSCRFVPMRPHAAHANPMRPHSTPCWCQPHDSDHTKRAHSP
jgi:hypothetical protein